MLHVNLYLEIIIRNRFRNKVKHRHERRTQQIVSAGHCLLGTSVSNICLSVELCMSNLHLYVKLYSVYFVTCVSDSTFLLNCTVCTL